MDLPAIEGLACLPSSAHTHYHREDEDHREKYMVVANDKDRVVCGDHGHHVIGLDLSKSFLRGPINSTTFLFRLVHLQTLNLAKNDFAESQIPSEIGLLTQLRSLNLSASGFSGQIPREISQLIQLSLLDLSRNTLELQSPSLENLVQNLTRLEELDLSGVDISSSVPDFLGNFSSLRFINLSDCWLQNEFPTTILQLPKLKVLDLGKNMDLTGSLPEFRNNSLLEHLILWSTSFSGDIPESIGSLTHLITLDLSLCFFSGPLPSEVANMTQLVQLTIGFNEFTGTIPSLVSLSKLVVLEFSNNKFENWSQPNWIEKLTELEELYGSRGNIFGEIPSFISNLTKLRIFDMSRNSLSGHIPSSFMNLTQLRFVDLANNQLQGPIPSLFSNFKSLQILRLNDNIFSGKVYLDKFLGLHQLKSLFVGFNKISIVDTNNVNATLLELEDLGLASCNLKEFPTFLISQRKLTTLFLDHNKIDGLVPVWIWKSSQETLKTIDLSYNLITGFHRHPRVLLWVRLETLILSHNKLRGWVPVPPQSVIVYDVSDNDLTGEVPSLICEVRSLRLLDMSSNSMTGRLPPCLGNLSNSLSVLDLKRNKFHGSIINTFSHRCRLKRLDLSENQFQGRVPRSLANCTHLVVLSLGDNSFDDVFRSWMGSLVKLQVLILRSNKFHGAMEGPIDDSSQFPKMRIIDLSNNGFSGRLPHKYFQIWNAIKSVYAGKSSVMQIEIAVTLFVHQNEWPYSMTLVNKCVKTEYQCILDIFTAIDLSCNNFKGKIPESLHDLQGLESLNLSNNHLTGRVLPSLENLKNLESLDLSQNELSGELPQELLQLGFLAILNVSFNHLNGRIPKGKQFNTFEDNSYVGNPELCGKPLSKVCRNSVATTSPSTSAHNKSESLSFLRGRVDWMVTFLGLGSGMVVGIVIGNILYTSFLRGPINSTTLLFRLVHLQTLNLAENDFLESQIPSEIGRLKQLRSLNLSASGFSGQIPREISQLIQLSLLDLSSNTLELQSPSLENLVQNLTRLEDLDLSGVDIRSSVPGFLGNFSSLRFINLSHCWLQNEFPTTILQLPKLKFLNLGKNMDLTGSLPEFHNNSLLEHLILWNTSFSGDIPESIGSLTHLITLDLSNCLFSGPLPSEVANMTQLVQLTIGFNEFTGTIPSLASISKLHLLEFSNNKFENWILPNWIGKLTELKQLYGSRGNIFGEIPSFLSNLTKLRIFDMPSNSLSGHIPSSFMNMTQLTFLRGPINSTTLLFRLVHLQTLNLAKNDFVESQIPSEIGRLKQLRSLNLSASGFSGQIPREISQLIQLSLLDLSRNKLELQSPSLGNLMQNLTPLEELDLSGVDISSSVPDFLGNFSSFRFINLSDCWFQNEFPTTILQLPKLKVLDLGKNMDLTGSLPEFRNNSLLEHLIL
ncbi:receptor-like protein 7 [Cynara cardunculus var. scolymus]|uniref:receptor-like protein 7 n=1 Tax=Cynara cardunculus var. scolymus TaxID=59895 RepID=UPI000D6312F8|nr:receptor-like protein 7 [Cynara cardunculus var. scolymus]